MNSFHLLQEVYDEDDDPRQRKQRERERERRKTRRMVICDRKMIKRNVIRKKLIS